MIAQQRRLFLETTTNDSSKATGPPVVQAILMMQLTHARTLGMVTAATKCFQSPPSSNITIALGDQTRFPTCPGELLYNSNRRVRQTMHRGKTSNHECRGIICSSLSHVFSQCRKRMCYAYQSNASMMMSRDAPFVFRGGPWVWSHENPPTTRLS